MKPEDIGQVPSIRKINSTTEFDQQQKDFAKYMEKAGENNALSAKSIQPTPFDLAHSGMVVTQGANMDSLIAQTKTAQALLGDMNQDLHTKNLKLKKSERYALRNKLSNANEHIKSAQVKMGLNPEPSTPAQGGVLGKIFSFIEDSQSNVSSIQNTLLSMKNKGETLQPADFLAIQIKLGQAQQQIEYASIMLSKAVENLKTLFNIQL